MRAYFDHCSYSSYCRKQMQANGMYAAVQSDPEINRTNRIKTCQRISFFRTTTVSNMHYNIINLC